MARLTAKARHALPKSKFGLPGSEGYPVDTKGRAVAAKGRATQAVNAGRMSKATEAKIDAKANKELGRGGDRKSQMFHMNRASEHIQKAVERKLAEGDK